MFLDLLMRHKSTKYRRPFLLLETLLAVAMIGLSSSFLLSTPMKVYQRHLEDLKKIELSRIADNIFVSLQFELKQKHPWSSLKEEPGDVISLDPISLKIDTSMNATYNCGYQLWVKKTKEGAENTTYRLLGCTLYFAQETKDFSWEKVLKSKRKNSLKFSYLIFTSGSPQSKVIP